MQAAADAVQDVTQNGKDSEPSLATAPNTTRSCGVEIGWYRYACQFSVHYLPPGNRNIDRHWATRR